MLPDFTDRVISGRAWADQLHKRVLAACRNPVLAVMPFTLASERHVSFLGQILLNLALVYFSLRFLWVIRLANPLISMRPRFQSYRALSPGLPCRETRLLWWFSPYLHLAKPPPFPDAKSPSWSGPGWF